jgi:long-chain-fatty-acid--[acyl-carrier-protein] ligase
VGEHLLEGNFPRLYLPNHPAEIDPQLIFTVVGKKHNIAPMISRQYYNLPIVRYFMKKMNAVPVSDLDKGVRDSHVMDNILNGALRGFQNGDSIMLYPSGQLADQGFEKVYNKQSAYNLVKVVPDEVRIIGVRISGLWGSMWSRAWTGVSPSFFNVFFKGVFVFFANFIFFIPKRKVQIEFVDITEEAKNKAQSLSRRDFNIYLESFYNVNGEEKLHYISHHFLKKKSTRKVPQRILDIRQKNLMNGLK